MSKAGAPEVRVCGICPRILSKYNKNPFCNGHSAEDILAYNTRVEKSAKGNRELRAFVGEHHKAGALADMFAEAEKRKTARLSKTEIAQYHEGLRLVYIASRTFHISMPSIFKLSSTSKNAKLARDVVGHILYAELKTSLDDICSFFGYKMDSTVLANLKQTRYLMLESEDMILAVDIVYREYQLQVSEEQN